MALNNILLLSQLAGHVIGLILSMCITIPLLIHTHYFNGHCLLFTTGIWEEEDGRFNAAWASKSFCNYPITVGFLLFVVCVIQIYRFTLLIRNESESSFLALFVDSFISVLLCAMVVFGAIIITLGFIVWCSDITQRFPSCDIADGLNITKQADINTAGFYNEMGTAQFGAWSSFAVWVGLSMFALLKLINDHQLNNMRVSMFLERQRLVNDGVYADSITEPPHMIAAEQEDYPVQEQDVTYRE